MPGKDARFVETFSKALDRTERQLLMLFYAEQLNPAEIGLVTLVDTDEAVDAPDQALRILDDVVVEKDAEVREALQPRG